VFMGRAIGQFDRSQGRRSDRRRIPRPPHKGKMVVVDATATNEAFKFKDVEAPEHENRRRRTSIETSVHEMFVR
jgi:hypothetical protein